MNKPMDTFELTTTISPVGAVEGYMPGFGNDFETEAFPDALPQGMNSPQKMQIWLVLRTIVGNRIYCTQPSE